MNYKSEARVLIYIHCERITTKLINMLTYLSPYLAVCVCVCMCVYVSWNAPDLSKFQVYSTLLTMLCIVSSEHTQNLKLPPWTAPAHPPFHSFSMILRFLKITKRLLLQKWDHTYFLPFRYLTLLTWHRQSPSRLTHAITEFAKALFFLTGIFSLSVSLGVENEYPSAAETRLGLSLKHQFSAYLPPHSLRISSF